MQVAYDRAMAVTIPYSSGDFFGQIGHVLCQLSVECNDPLLIG